MKQNVSLHKIITLYFIPKRDLVPRRHIYFIVDLV